MYFFNTFNICWKLGLRSLFTCRVSIKDVIYLIERRRRKKKKKKEKKKAEIFDTIKHFKKYLDHIQRVVVVLR